MRVSCAPLRGSGSDPRGAHVEGVEKIGHDVTTRSTDPFIAKMFKGSLRNERYLDEVKPEEHFFHGSNQQFAPGALIEPGHPGNFVRSMKHVYMTTQSEGTDQYKHAYPVVTHSSRCCGHSAACLGSEDELSEMR